MAKKKNQEGIDIFEEPYISQAQLSSMIQELTQSIDSATSGINAKYLLFIPLFLAEVAQSVALAAARTLDARYVNKDLIPVFVLLIMIFASLETLLAARLIHTRGMRRNLSLENEILSQMAEMFANNEPNNAGFVLGIAKIVHTEISDENLKKEILGIIDDILEQSDLAQFNNNLLQFLKYFDKELADFRAQQTLTETMNFDVAQLQVYIKSLIQRLMAEQAYTRESEPDENSEQVIDRMVTGTINLAEG